MIGYYEYRELEAMNFLSLGKDVRISKTSSCTMLKEFRLVITFGLIIFVP